MAVLSGLLLYPKETAPPDVGGGRPLRRLWEPMCGNLWSFREFFSRQGKSRRSGEPDRKKHDTEKGHRERKKTKIKKASRSASEWLKNSMKGKTNFEKIKEWHTAT